MLEQVIVLTHALATDEEIEPYACSLFESMPVLCVTGRSAKVQPTCHPKEAVWYGWRDHILPYILSNKHHQDTWFIVLEEDWRLYPDHCEAVPKKTTGHTVRQGLDVRAWKEGRLAEEDKPHPHDRS